VRVTRAFEIDMYKSILRFVTVLLVPCLLTDTRALAAYHLSVQAQGIHQTTTLPSRIQEEALAEKPISAHDDIGVFLTFRRWLADRVAAFGSARRDQEKYSLGNLRKPFHNVANALEELHLPEPIASLVVKFRKSPDDVMQTVDPLLSEIAPLWLRLMNVPRGGDVNRGASKKEAWSVADHEALIVLMALAQARLKEWSYDTTEKVLRLILIHDMPEIIPPYDMTPKNNPFLWRFRTLKHAWESMVMHFLLLRLPKDVRGPWRSAYQSVHDERDLLAVWAEETDKQAGVVQLLAQAWRFRNRPDININSFLEPYALTDTHQWSDAKKRGLLMADPYDRFNITRESLISALRIVGSATRLSKVVGLGEKSVIYLTESEGVKQAIEIVGGKGEHPVKYKKRMLAQKAISMLRLQETNYLPRLDGIYKEGNFVPVPDNKTFDEETANEWVGKQVEAIRREFIDGKKLGQALKDGELTVETLDAQLREMQSQFIRHGFLLIHFRPENFRVRSDGKPILIRALAVKPLSYFRNKKEAIENAERHQKELIDQIPELLREITPTSGHSHDPSHRAA
jgi:5'-deoxynucleotidase YfbR-like HD superfamily hydrolase